MQDMSFSAIDNSLTRLNYGSLNYTHKYRKPGNVFYLLSRFSNPTSNRDQLLINSAGNGEHITKPAAIPVMVTIQKVHLKPYCNKTLIKNRQVYYGGSKLIIRDNKSNTALDSNNVAVTTPFSMQQVVSSSYGDADWTIKKLTVHTGLRYDYNTNNYTGTGK